MIFTDQWSGYVELNNLDYDHKTVNHEQYNVDLVTLANTQFIEAT